MTTKPWTSGSKELLEHAVGHFAHGTSFDYRIAMISLDNAVELAIRTFRLDGVSLGDLEGYHRLTRTAAVPRRFGAHRCRTETFAEGTSTTPVRF
jgi:hypothetical protein